MENKTIKAKHPFAKLEVGGPIFRMNTHTGEPLEYMVRSIERANPMKYGLNMLKISFYKIAPPNPDKLDTTALVERALQLEKMGELKLPVEWVVFPKFAETTMTKTVPPYIYGASKAVLEDFKMAHHG
jgi:hypothetical protein